MFFIVLVILIQLQRAYVKVVGFSKNLRISKCLDLSSGQKCELLKSYDVFPYISLRDATA